MKKRNPILGVVCLLILCGIGSDRSGGLLDVW